MRPAALLSIVQAASAFSTQARIRSNILGKGISGNWKDNEVIFLPNIGDTDRRCSKVAAKLSDEELGKCHDASDDIQRAPQFLTKLFTEPMGDVSDSATANLEIGNSDQNRFVRLFSKTSSNWNLVRNNSTFSATELRQGLSLGVDARDTRRPGIWDGRASLKFSVVDGKQTSTDEIKLRVAPVLVHNHLDKIERVVSVAGNDSVTPWQERFAGALTSLSSELKLPKPMLLEGSDDIWAQDIVEPSYVSMPSSDGPVSLRVNIRSSQDERVAGRQVFEQMRSTGVGAVQHLGSKSTEGVRLEINSMGNLECTPPFEHDGKVWPAGRIIMGRHGPYEPHILPYLRAQEVQDPILLDTSWLWVGHVDEFIQFLPAETERGWVIVVADPEAGLKLLQDAQRDGHGNFPLLSRKTDPPMNGVTLENVTKETSGSISVPVPEETIEEFLSDPEHANTAKEAGKRIKANINLLKAEIGISDEEVYHLPTVFTNEDRSKLPFIGPRAPDETLACVAKFPATINGVVLTGFNTYLAPNPWGSIIDGKDVMAEATKDLYAQLGWKVKFVDNWNSHHAWGGEVHCGTNTLRETCRRWWS